MQGYNDGLTSLPQKDDYAAPRLSPELAAQEDFADFERQAVTKQIFEEGLGLAGVALLKQVCRSLRCVIANYTHVAALQWRLRCLGSALTAISLLLCCLQPAVMPLHLFSLFLCCNAISFVQADLAKSLSRK